MIETVYKSLVVPSILGNQLDSIQRITITYFHDGTTKIPSRTN
jgi:hypothetical protein